MVVDDYLKWGQALGTLLLGFVGLWFAQNYRRQLKIKLADRRLQAYARLWALTQVAAPTRREPLSEDERRALYDEMTGWYYGEGDGMLLTDRSRELYLRVKANIVCSDDAVTPGLLRAHLADEAPDGIAARRGCISIRQISLLRTQLKADLAIYGVNFYRGLRPDEAELLRDSRISMRRKPWRGRLLARRRDDRPGPCLCGRCIAEVIN